MVVYVNARTVFFFASVSCYPDELKFANMFIFQQLLVFYNIRHLLTVFRLTSDLHCGTAMQRSLRLD